MFRVRHLDHHVVEHRHVGTDRHPVVEEARIIDLAVLVVDVFLVQRPADALYGTALHLALDISRVDRFPDILERRVPDHPDDPELHIDLDVADMGREAAFGAGGVELLARADRPAGLVGPCRQFLQCQGLELAGIVSRRAGGTV